MRSQGSALGALDLLELVDLVALAVVGPPMRSANRDWNQGSLLIGVSRGRSKAATGESETG